MRGVAVVLSALVACGRSGFDARLDAAGDVAIDAPPPPGVYIANAGGQVIEVFALSASGDVAPMRTIAGPSTGLDGPEGLYVDVAHRELYAGNFFTPYSIRVFPLEASGDVAPIRTLDAGTTSRLLEPRTPIVDLEHDELILIDFDSAVRTYPRTAAGQVAPLREISGATTLLDNPGAIALDPVADELYVTSASAGGLNVRGVLVFDRTASGNVAPKRVISGANTRFGTTSGGYWLALDLAARELFVNAHDGAGVVAFDMTANGNATPKRDLVGAATGLVDATALFVDTAANRLDVVQRNPTNQISVFARDATGNAAPVMTLAGIATGLVDPWGFAIDGATAFTGP